MYNRGPLARKIQYGANICCTLLVILDLCRIVQHYKEESHQIMCALIPNIYAQNDHITTICLHM